MSGSCSSNTSFRCLIQWIYLCLIIWSGVKVVWWRFTLCMHLNRRIFRNPLKHSPSKEGQSVIFSFPTGLLSFTSEIIFLSTGSVKLKRYGLSESISGLFFTLCSCQLFVAQKLGKCQSEPGQNEIYFMYQVGEIWLFLLEQIVHYNGIYNKWGVLLRWMEMKLIWLRCDLCFAYEDLKHPYRVSNFHAI